MRLDARPAANRATGPSPSTPAPPAPPASPARKAASTRAASEGAATGRRAATPLPPRAPEPSLPPPPSPPPQSQLPQEQAPLPAATPAAAATSPLAASTTTTTTITSRDRNDAALRRSVTALDGGSPRGGERTPAAHSTAFERSPSRSQRVRPCSRPILFVLYLLALLLLQTPGHHSAVAAAETTSGSGAKSADNTGNDNIGNHKNNNNNHNNNNNANRGAAVRHPYNEYTWELNQLNPWLSACDLAGPAPADLQGSCGPPEVPKNCPGPCATLRGRKEGPDLFDDVIEMLERIVNATGGTIPRPRRDLSQHHQHGARTSEAAGEVGGADGGGGAGDKTGKRSARGAKQPKKEPTAPEQCLFYLEESHKRDVCREDFGRASSRSFLSPRENRYWFMNGLRLRHCCEHAAVNALAPGKGGPLEAVLNGGRGCVEALDKLLLVDSLAARLHCEFEEVLARYDCGQSYSIIHNCTHCKEAYRKWVCSSLVPYFAHEGPLDLEPSEESWTGRRIRPCRSLCQSVEQRCPYLLPGDRAPAYPTQYAGEPTFLCRDPNIPETGEQAARALHPNSDDECCFKVCSEEIPALGICANCTGHVPYMGPKHYDPPTAPQCDIATLPGQQQSMRAQSPLCGSSGFNSIIIDPNSFFLETSESSSEAPSTIASTSSGTATATITATATSITGSTSSTSSSSAASVVSSSPVPLLCLFWLWGVLFSSQCSVRRLLGLFSLAERCLRALRVTCARLLLLLIVLTAQLILPKSLSRRHSRVPHDRNRRPRRRHRRRRLRRCLRHRCEARGRRCYPAGSSGYVSPESIDIASSSLSSSSSSSSAAVAGSLVLAERRPRGERHCCRCCCCYRWWLWPGRWKNDCSTWAQLRYGDARCRCCHRRRCCCWCYWRWLWPCRWKGPRRRGSPVSGARHPLALLLFRGRQQPLRPRKKRRRKVRFGASCCRELDLARSTSWCREPS